MASSIEHSGVTGLRVERASSVREIGLNAWGRLEGGRCLYLSYPWLLWAEQDAAYEPTYVLARDDADRIVGALPTYRWDRGGGSLNAWYDPVKVFVAPSVSGSPDTDQWFPVLLLGSRAGYHGDCLVDARLDQKQMETVIGRLVMAAHRVAEDAGARSKAMMYVPGLTANTICGLGGEAQRAVPTSAEAVINTEWASFDDYLRQFPKRRRNNISSEIKTFQATGNVLRETTLGQSFDCIGPLLGRLQRKYGSADTDEEMTKRLESQAATLDAISRVILETRRGEVVGFSLCYEWSDVLYVRATGFDAEAGSARFAYFVAAIYWPVRYAIEHGLRAVNLGVSSYQGKVARGASLAPLWSLVWPPPGADSASLAALEQPAAEAAEAEAVVPGTFGGRRLVS